MPDPSHGKDNSSDNHSQRYHNSGNFLPDLQMSSCALGNLSGYRLPDVFFGRSLGGVRLNESVISRLGHTDFHVMTHRNQCESEDLDILFLLKFTNLLLQCLFSVMNVALYSAKGNGEQAGNLVVRIPLLMHGKAHGPLWGNAVHSLLQ